MANHIPMPPSLLAVPNIPFEHQTLEQLRAERDYWAACVAANVDPEGGRRADELRHACEMWISVREQESVDGPRSSA